VLVNNAGINPIEALGEISAENWAQTIQVNLTAPFLLIQGLAPGMTARGWGRVVNISSIWAAVSKAKRASYSAAKTGLIGLTRTSAIELAPHGVLVNAVCPGFVETELTRANNPPEALEVIRKTIPLGRLAQPEEIARFVAFLCSEQNTYLTGQSIVIDGGFVSQ
jgi:3-oxoacyl-[acyl-carrier protein] reductase